MLRKCRWFLRTGLLTATVLGLLTGAGAQDLLTTAHRVTQTTGWAAADCYGWLSDHEVLFFHTVGKTTKPVRLDVTSGRQTPLTFMDPAWAVLAKDENGARPGFTASLAPDGKRLLWMIPGFDTTWVFAADVDGAHQFQIGYSGDSAPPSCQWLADSQELVSFHLDTKGLQARVLRLDRPSLGLDTDAVSTGVTGAFGTRGPVLVTPDHRILSDTWDPRGPATPTVCVMQAAFMPAAGVATGTATITLPAGAVAVGMTYAPQGDRIAWVLRRPGGRVSLCVCRIDGTGWREIGALRSSNDGLDSLRWLPSGRGVSFLRQGALWTVLVPGAAS
jgi:hypothetical protein